MPRRAELPVELQERRNPYWGVEAQLVKRLIQLRSWFQGPPGSVGSLLVPLLLSQLVLSLSLPLSLSNK